MFKKGDIVKPVNGENEMTVEASSWNMTVCSFLKFDDRGMPEYSRIEYPTSALKKVDKF